MSIGAIPLEPLKDVTKESYKHDRGQAAWLFNMLVQRAFKQVHENSNRCSYTHDLSGWGYTSELLASRGMTMSLRYERTKGPGSIHRELFVLRVPKVANENTVGEYFDHSNDVRERFIDHLLSIPRVEWPKKGLVWWPLNVEVLYQRQSAQEAPHTEDLSLKVVSQFIIHKGLVQETP